MSEGQAFRTHTKIPRLKSQASRSNYGAGGSLRYQLAPIHKSLIEHMKRMLEACEQSVDKKLKQSIKALSESW